MKMKRKCPFCVQLRDRILYESELLIGIWDRHPVSPGHALLLPKRHIGTWFEASVEEQKELFSAIAIAKQEIEKAHKPDGYNIGFNSGIAAGQTVPHLHLHVIPRYTGDVADPRGGLRWVIPSKATYWDE